MIQHDYWHPEGKFIVYDNWENLFIINVEIGEQHKLSFPKDRFEGIRLNQWSPDGKRIAFRAERGTGPSLWTVKNLLATKVAEK